MSNGKWRDAFEKQRQITEKRNISKFTRYYQGQYNKGVDNVLNTGSILTIKTYLLLSFLIICI